MRSLAALVLVALIAGCFNVSWDGGERVEGSGTAATRTIEADGVRQISLAAPGTLVVTPGSAPLVIEGDDNLVERLVVDVDGDELSIGTPNRESFRPELPLRFRVGVERLEWIEIAGSGRIEASDVEAGDLEIEIAGSGAVVVAGLRADEVVVEVAGSGDVELAGQTGRLAVEIAGSGDVDAGALRAEEAEVSIAGAGDVTLRAEKALAVQIMGAGDVRYYGSPEVSRSVMGAGDVTRLGD